MKRIRVNWAGIVLSVIFITVSAIVRKDIGPLAMIAMVAFCLLVLSPFRVERERRREKK